MARSENGRGVSGHCFPTVCVLVCVPMYVCMYICVITRWQEGLVDSVPSACLGTCVYVCICMITRCANDRRRHRKPC